jgi:putative salt-induced outer membrane protein YdiY
MRVKDMIRGAALVLALLAATGVRAQSEEKKYGWFFTTELTSVVTSGNAESNTFGLSASLRRALEFSELKIDGGAIRTESALTFRTAVGTSTDYEIFEDEQREKTAEAYYLRGIYNRTITKRFTLFGGADWLRNPFAGTESRFLIAAGAGNIWADSDHTRFKTNYSVTYTFEADVVDNPFASTKFPGVRLSYDYWRQLTVSTQLTSDLTVDWNLDVTDDVRALFNVGLPIAVSSKLAFKPSLNVQWRNMPALSEVALFDSGGTDTGTKVLVPLEELDMIFKAALVVNL